VASDIFCRRRIQGRIGVAEDKNIPGGDLGGPVHCGRFPVALFIVEEADCGVMANDLHGPVGGAVRNEDKFYFFRRVVLSEGIEDLLFDEVFFVEGGDDKGDAGEGAGGYFRGCFDKSSYLIQGKGDDGIAGVIVKNDKAADKKNIFPIMHLCSKYD